MNSNKLNLTIIFSLLVLFGAVYTPAQEHVWRQAASEPTAANQRGEYALAQTLYKEAIELQQKAVGDDIPAVAISLNNLAVFYQDQSKYPEAEQAYLQALAI